ncbi:Mak16-domain-containing protein [Piedraia hortae CBS 480.64]|uniref:Protein MAK16 n=1 Tax=Piedraia hortae CBS 480.64 TaxID=1314780 RepID=A0A6A7BPF0_9PEZI|nr:Mak16-domain-containing protein [Piedraia hortae CBS 480.64]
MSSDEITWQIINTQFCSFKLTLPNRTRGRGHVGGASTFCRNEYNLTGVCSRQTCPIANSRYATVRTDPATGRIYLYIKEPERAHLPKRWWERIRLSDNYTKAVEEVQTRLAHWNGGAVNRCLQRLTRLVQVRARERRLVKEQERLGERVVGRLAPKVRRREEGRERRAVAAAKVERAIEKELVERLKSGVYGEVPLNCDEKVWEKVLDSMVEAEEGEEEEEEEEEHEVEYEKDAQVEYVEGEDSDEDLEDWFSGDSGDEEDGEDGEGGEGGEGDEETGNKRKRKDKMKGQRKKGPKMTIEYEEEAAPPEMEMQTVKW